MKILRHLVSFIFVLLVSCTAKVREETNVDEKNDAKNDGPERLVFRSRLSQQLSACVGKSVKEIRDIVHAVCGDYRVSVFCEPPTMVRGIEIEYNNGGIIYLYIDPADEIFAKMRESTGVKVSQLEECVVSGIDLIHIANDERHQFGSNIPIHSRPHNWWKRSGE